MTDNVRPVVTEVSAVAKAGPTKEPAKDAKPKPAKPLKDAPGRKPAEAKAAAKPAKDEAKPAAKKAPAKKPAAKK